MGKKAPKAPDPYVTAQAQGTMNKETAAEQKRLAMDSEFTPMGTRKYVADANSPSGYRMVEKYTPEIQGLFDSGVNAANQYADISGAQLGRVGESLDQPFSFDAGRGQVLSDINRKMMDPLWQGRDEALQTQLANEGIGQGSKAYQDRTRQFGQQRDDAYDKMFLDSYTTGNNAALQEHMLPLMEYSQLTGSGAGVQMPGLPQFASTPAPGVAPVDLAGLVNNNYNQQVSSYNAGLGGLFGLGAAGLGGWAKSGFVNPFSDRRLKSDVVRVGEDPRGWGIYEFRYLWGPERYRGFMADEVEKIRPDVVSIVPGTAYKGVNYAALGGGMTLLEEGAANGN